MRPRFYIGVGRYDSLVRTRFKDHTYGRDSFSKPEIDVDAKLAHGTYGALLFDKRWISKRAEILARDHHACVICGNHESLQVHHRQYHYVKVLQQFKAPWDYENNLMITLCEGCHSKGHSKYRVPNIFL